MSLTLCIGAQISGLASELNSKRKCVCSRGDTWRSWHFQKFIDKCFRFATAISLTFFLESKNFQSLDPLCEDDHDVTMSKLLSEKDY